MAAASLFGHLAVVAIIVGAGTSLWRGPPAPTGNDHLARSGAEGPNTGGITAIGGRDVQQATPPGAKPEPATQPPRSAGDDAA
jgi:hypothetical protein